jgi:flagellar motor switch protein FliM
MRTATDTRHKVPVRPFLRRLALAVIGMSVLGGVFLLYIRPTFMIAMVDQLWSCF